MRFHVILSIIAAMTIGACAQVESSNPSQNATTTTAAASDVGTNELAEKWAGTWSGSWGGSCTGSIEVSGVTQKGADVVYSWGHCGNARPGSNKTIGRFEGDTLVVDLYARTTARYTHISEDSLEGIYSRPASRVARTTSGSGQGVFTRS